VNPDLVVARLDNDIAKDIDRMAAMNQGASRILASLISNRSHLAKRLPTRDAIQNRINYVERKAAGNADDMKAVMHLLSTTFKDNVLYFAANKDEFIIVLSSVQCIQLANSNGRNWIGIDGCHHKKTRRKTVLIPVITSDDRGRCAPLAFLLASGHETSKVVRVLCEQLKTEVDKLPENAHNKWQTQCVMMDKSNAIFKGVTKAWPWANDRIRLCQFHAIQV